jgi:carboxymethylenebutenolidase
MPMIKLTASDGHSFGAYTAGAENLTVGLVVVQEIFGVNSHMRHASDVLAAAGFKVICPAIFDRAERDVELGYNAETVQKGGALRGQISDADTLKDIEAAARALGTPRVGIIGYCWGGTLAWLGATRTDLFQAAVGWYGGGIAATKDETPHCPVQLHFGSQDTHISQTDVESIRKAQPGVEVFIYDADHGFGCEERGSFEPKSYAEAQARSLAFFRKHLGSTAN